MPCGISRHARLNPTDHEPAPSEFRNWPWWRDSPGLNFGAFSDFDPPLGRTLPDASPAVLHVEKSREFPLKRRWVEVADESEGLTWPETIEHRQDCCLLFGRGKSPHIKGHVILGLDGH